MEEADNSMFWGWSSAEVAVRHRFDAWQGALNSSHFHWTLRCPETAEPSAEGAGDFRARLRVGRLGLAHVARCECDPCGGYRDRFAIARDTEPYYGLLFMLRGIELVTIGDRTTCLQPGSFLMWDTTRPVSFMLRSPVDKITMFVPQDLMHKALPPRHCLVGRAADFQDGLGAVATSHVLAIADQAEHMQERQCGAAVETALELIATSLEGRSPAAGDAARSDQLDRVKRYIEENLGCPELSPREIADRFHISLRYLYLLFGDESTSVSRWIMERRLEHCRRQLVCSHRSFSITEVALRWGFNDPAHFSRAFKKRYGLSPRACRGGIDP